MENLNNQSTAKDYTEEIKRWEEEDVLQLANHFHKLNTNKGQFERTSCFMMSYDDVKTFQGMKDSIMDLRIYLALKTQNKEAHTFCPLLRVTNDKEAHTFFELTGNDNNVEILNTTKSAEVPELFKNMICDNWDAVDTNLIDDLFTARVKNVKGVEVTVRVKYFQISEEIIDDVIKKISEVKGVTLYSGIDMNKFPDKYQISFTPVLGFQHDEQDTSDLTFGLKSILEFSKGETFIEYSSPCPPTC